MSHRNIKISITSSRMTPSPPWIRQSNSLIRRIRWPDVERRSIRCCCYSAVAGSGCNLKEMSQVLTLDGNWRCRRMWIQQMLATPDYPDIHPVSGRHKNNIFITHRCLLLIQLNPLNVMITLGQTKSDNKTEY